MDKTAKVSIATEDKQCRFDAIQRRINVLNNGSPVGQVSIMKWLLDLGEKDLLEQERIAKEKETTKA